MKKRMKTRDGVNIYSAIAVLIHIVDIIVEEETKGN